MISLRSALNMEVGKNIYLCLTGAGVVVFMFYCIRMQFFPTGLTLSDVIFFLMVITSFSLILVFFILCWYSMSVIVATLSLKGAFFIATRNKNPKALRSFKGTRRIARKMKIYEPIWGHVIISFMAIFTIYLVVRSKNVDVLPIFSSVMMTAALIMIIPNIYFDKSIEKKKKNKVAALVTGAAFIFFFMLSGMAPVLSDAGMTIIGVRKSSVTIMLQGGDLKMARHLTGNQDQNYFTGEALFTGVGATSLLVINKKRIIVKNENLSLSF